MFSKLQLGKKKMEMVICSGSQYIPPLCYNQLNIKQLYVEWGRVGYLDMRIIKAEVW